ncbi:recombinase family protein [Alicyclobacillus acidocaldarius]|uniref:Resolvase domain protein n=1 Tax=Alicyclobacillus acidocaldarius subsp. acidocaldarius (strain ATCC 27009 / DSM 446 / BCRC 14685 / JCM 5260 / KCTC 1825 / NBRC 15652 / NCIMB 11725 / NRRL B-14509 / 104-IA) TaxID=521098 RepID=C8WW38_ALIAD|nr:recombinase family protein [Alicyclobacillus acidocaldarius]ACV58310.1 Resolvase domain protein [Alicyclobacillus acidocaldarius subsp. acidocaldarius DSM 446]
MTERHLALYVRVSTEEQAASGHSLREQEEQLVEYARSHGFPRYELYCDDGYSGKSLNRPAMERLRADIRAGCVLGVVTTRIDRLTRSVADFARLVDEMNLHGVFYRSTRQNFEISTAMGRLVAQMLSVIAEFEREMIAERVHENLLAMAQRGELATKPPFGYRLVNGRLTPDPREARWVREGARLLLTGASPRDVAMEFNALGVRTKTGRLWTDRTVRTLFSNPALAGVSVWNRRKTQGSRRTEREPTEWVCVEGAHEAILSREEFEALRGMLERRRALSPRSQGSKRPLAGIARCGFCGSAMYAGWQVSKRGHERQKRPIYRCGRYVTGGGCTPNQVDASALEMLVVEELLRRVRPELEPVVSAYRAHAASNELRTVQRKRRVALARLSRLAEAYASGVVSEEAFSREQVRLLRVLEACREAEAQAAALSTTDGWDAWVRELCARLAGDPHLERALFLTVVREVRVFRPKRSREVDVDLVLRLE